MSEIEYAQKTDARELYDLQRLAFLSEVEMTGSRQIPALMETFEEFLADFEQWTFLVFRNGEGKIVGAVRFKKEGTRIDVGRLMVHQDYRNQKIASRLMKRVEDAAEGEYLELFTCTRSHTNIQLYQKLGYRQSEIVDKGELPFVYMRKNL